MNNVNQPSQNYGNDYSNQYEPKSDFVKNDGMQTGRLRVEDDDIPPYLRKLKEHR